MERQDPVDVGDERTQLTQFLDWLRATILMKVDGLDREQMSMTTAASDLTLAGLLKHLAVVEDGWFRRALLGEPPAAWYRDFVDDPDWDFRTAADDDPRALVARYQQACERSREAVASMASLDDLTAEVPGSDGSHRFNVRWVLLHMIEETARHAGHADLLREAIDGATGE
jgi:uncharacterized damage-inducible protein DinB